MSDLNELVKTAPLEVLRAALDGGEDPSGAAAAVHFAVDRRQDLDAALLLMERGAGLSATNESYGRDVLQLAARHNDPEMLQLALELGADPNRYRSRSEPALHVAADRERGADAVRLLLEAGADVHARTPNNITALHKAALNGSAASVEMLLAAGADVNLISLKEVPGGTHHYICGSPLHWALGYERRGGAAVVRVLLDAGADPTLQDERGWLPVHIAGDVHQSITPFKELLERRPEMATATDARGWTPLHHAADRGHSRMLAHLLSLDSVDVHAEIPATKKRAIHLAAEKGMGVAELLAAGAEVDVRLKNGRTPLMLAADKKNARALKALIAAGAELDAVDNAGICALMFGVLRDRERIIRPLVEAGASPDVAVTVKKKIVKTTLNPGDTPRSACPARQRHLLPGAS